MRKEDKGMYQCFVRNEQESAQGSAELKLGGRCTYISMVVGGRGGSCGSQKGFDFFNKKFFCFDNVDVGISAVMASDEC